MNSRLGMPRTSGQAEIKTPVPSRALTVNGVPGFAVPSAFCYNGGEWRDQMQDSLGTTYVEIPEYPDDRCWRIGTLHLASGTGVGEVVRHGRHPEAHARFAELVDLSDLTGMPLEDDDYQVLIMGEGPVLRFSDGTEVWYCGMGTAVLSAVTGDDPVSLHNELEGG